MIIRQNVSEWIGKTIHNIIVDDGLDNSLYMVEDVVIEFTDGTAFRLARDWRGHECYISQYELEEK